MESVHACVRVFLSPTPSLRTIFTPHTTLKSHIYSQHYIYITSVAFIVDGLSSGRCLRSGVELLLLKCCFTSTETVGLLGTGVQDGHLDFLTAPELARGGTPGVETTEHYRVWKCLLVARKQ